MARLRFGRLTEAWKGEAADFTPLLAEQLDAIGAEIGVDLASVGESEVQTTGGRRIDIVAQGEDGSEFVIENQYGRADHDHLTRGLSYAVARRVPCCCHLFERPCGAGLRARHRRVARGSACGPHRRQPVGAALFRRGRAQASGVSVPAQEGTAASQSSRSQPPSSVRAPTGSSASTDRNARLERRRAGSPQIRRTPCSNSAPKLRTPTRLHSVTP